MEISIAYGNPDHPYWKSLEVSEGSTIAEVIESSGVLERFPDIDLAAQKVGVFGKLAKLDAKVTSGDRIEIYRAITADPKKVKRRKKEETRD
ncbi:MAG: RnfH family protein [Methylohalobius crimeensis]